MATSLLTPDNPKVREDAQSFAWKLGLPELDGRVWSEVPT